MISVLVVDDVELVRERLAHLVGRDGRLRLAGKARDGVEALEMIEAHRPDVVVLDVTMPRMGGIGVLRVMRRKWSAIKVLILTAGFSVDLDEVIVSRPDALLYKNDIAENQVCDEIIALVAGKGRTVGQGVLRSALDAASKPRTLTASEAAVLRCAAKDAGAKEIAAMLGRSVKTVRNQLQAIHIKMGVSTTTGAVAKAYEMGLLPGSNYRSPT